MMIEAPLTEDDTSALLATAVATLTERARFPIVFGGLVRNDRVVVSHLLGNRRKSLQGLIVNSGSGLGGRVLLESRPRMTSDYGKSRAITHDYDGPVLAEGITTLLAVPVISEGTVRAVLYGGLRADFTIGGVAIEPAVAVAGELAAHMSRSAPAHTISVPSRSSSAAAATMEDLRVLYEQIRSIAAHQSDPDVRSQLEAVQHNIMALAHRADEPDEGGATEHPLTARELDVLTLAASGRTNAAIGGILGVTESTVKSYMNAAMHKLAATTRLEAVTIARRLRMLP